MSKFKAGALLLALVLVLTYFGFSKDVPFTKGYRLKAVMENANSIRTNSPVRIAGVNVGKVKSVEVYEEDGKPTNLSLIEMEIQDQGLPIHSDATIKVRPRIFLEGNFFVDIQPGTPSAKKLGSGSTVPVSRTSNPTQLDEVLTALQSDTREDLQVVLDELGGALSDKPTAARDAQADRDTRGEPAARSFNDTYRHAPAALRDTALVNEAALGTEPRDLSKLIDSFGKVAGGLVANEDSLKDLITNLNITTGAFAIEQANLRETIRQLNPTLRSANRALASLNAAFPPTRAFAREILPGVRATPETIALSFPWIRESRLLFRRSELRGLAQELSPTSASLAKLTDDSLRLLPQLNLINRCIKDVILPTGDVVVQDGALTTGAENYKEFWYTLVGLAGEGQNFDGNGHYVRFQPGGGDQTISTGAGSLSGDELFGNAASRPLGNRPSYPGKRPPYNNTFVCHRNTLPNINGAAASRGTAAPRTVARGSDARTVSNSELRAAPARSSDSGAPDVFEQLASKLNPFAGYDKLAATIKPVQEATP